MCWENISFFNRRSVLLHENLWFVFLLCVGTLWQVLTPEDQTLEDWWLCWVHVWF